MTIRRNILPLGYALAAAFSLAGLAGEPIRFSKPAVPIAVLPKEEVPNARERGIDFRSLDVEQQRQPISPLRQPQQQTFIRMEPRDENRDSLHPLLRTPALFADPDEEKKRKEAANDPLKPITQVPRTVSDILNEKPAVSRLRTDSSHPLSPITRFDWDGRDANQRKNDSPLGRAELPWKIASTAENRNEERIRSPFLPREETGARFDSARPNSLADLFGAPPAKEEPTPAQLERRANFEALLNPKSGMDGKSLNPLDPVVESANAKPASLAMPTLNSGSSLPKDPTAAFNQQHERLRGPTIENVNKDFNRSKPASAANDPRAQTPLNRTPLFRDFPTRKQ